MIIYKLIGLPSMNTYINKKNMIREFVIELDNLLENESILNEQLFHATSYATIYKLCMDNNLSYDELIVQLGDSFNGMITAMEATFCGDKKIDVAFNHDGNIYVNDGAMRTPLINLDDIKEKFKKLK
jgi:hypothetical protein